MANDWVDVLMPRRVSSDFIWVLTHNWNCNKYVHSKDRTPQQIRDDVYNEPYFKMLLDENPHLRVRIERILDEMSHTWSLRSIRFIGYFLTKIMKSIYGHVWVNDYVHISESSIYSTIECDRNLHDVLNNLSKCAPIMYIPSHRSYADFLLFSYVCFHFNLPFPSIAAGIDFLSLNQIASLLRSCGAFYIRRSFKHNNDNLYWHVFRAYVQTQLRGGERPMEFFIEGTRSRSGKSLYPKTGLLSVALELFMTAQIPDLIIIPISMSYDRTLEEPLYAKELWPFDSANGGKKPPETTKHLISGAKAILSQDHGSVYIRFGEPISVRQLLEKNDFRKSHTLDSKYDPNPYESIPEQNFTLNLSKMIINRQQNGFVFSPFTLSSLSILSYVFNRNPNDESVITLPFNSLLEDVRALSELISDDNLSFKMINESIESSLIKSFHVHSNIITLSEDNSYVHFDIGKPLNIIQLQQYANHSMQLLIDFACYLFVNGDFRKYDMIKQILSREFIFDANDTDESYFNAQIKCSHIQDDSRVNEILCLRIEYYIKNYLIIGHWLMNHQMLYNTIDVRSLSKEIQKDTFLCSDLIQNALTVMSGNTQEGHKLKDNSEQNSLTKIIDELNDLLKHNNNIHSAYIPIIKLKANL